MSIGSKLGSAAGQAMSALRKPAVFAARITEHFGSDPARLPIVERSFGASDVPNLQTALDAWLLEPGRSHELFGVLHPEMQFGGLNLANLLMAGGMPPFAREAPAEGPVHYRQIDGGRVGSIACVDPGLYLVRDQRGPLAVLVGGVRDYGYGARTSRLEVMASDRKHAERFLADIDAGIRRRNIYRGQIVGLSLDERHAITVGFQPLPVIARDDIVLPEGVLNRIERNAMGYSSHRDKLLRAGRHLKRGILLHGPPGTGKTFTAMYIAGHSEARTVILITGREQALIVEAARLARMLEPATVIIEDVDLVAEERTRPGACNTVLFELLNQMDGLNADADVLFILTTNRPDVLEPALASRPGRIDLAVQVPLPDAVCRQRLFEGYGRGLALPEGIIPKLVTRTEGASAAFVRELLRKAALYAADDAGDVKVRAEHLEEALRDLVFLGGSLNRSLLGFAGSGTGAPPA